MGFLRGTFALVRSGLGQTRRLLGGELVDRLRGRVLDAALLGEIEDHLLRSDVGVEAASAIMGDLREGVAGGALAKGEDAIKDDFPPKQEALKKVHQPLFMHKDFLQTQLLLRTHQPMSR